MKNHYDLFSSKLKKTRAWRNPDNHPCSRVDMGAKKMGKEEEQPSGENCLKKGGGRGNHKIKGIALSEVQQSMQRTRSDRI